MAVTGKTAAIANALKYRLSTLTLSPVRRIAWPNAAFAPVAGEIYLEPTVLPNRTDYGAVGANAPRRHQGLYQISVRGPAITPTPEVQDEIADLIIEHFEAETIISNGVTVRIGSFDGSPGLPYRVSALIESGWRNIPVTIPWWCDTFS